jgi:hypothetical protein
VAYVQRYKKGEQGGFDSSTKRWRDKNGRFRSRDYIVLGGEETEGIGYYFERESERSSIIRAAEHIEQLVGGRDPNQIQAAIYDEGADPMPANIHAMMELSEYFCNTEGDVFQTIEAPMQIGLRRLLVNSKDKGVEEEFRELYDEGYLDMQEIAYGIWMCMFIYGQAFPLELYDGNTPVGIVLLNPKSMEVGRSTSFGYYTLDMRIDKDWEEQIKRSAHPNLVFNSLGSDFNEQAQSGHLPIRREFCAPVRYTSVPFKRYAIPPLARAFRAISTRQVLEELIRATIEGYRNQLWVFRLGTEEKPASPKKIQFFHSLIAGSSGDRTGYLVWDYNLQVEVYTPKPLDQMLGNERWQAVTADIFRKLGVSTRIVSGEAPMGSSRAGEEIDVKVLLARLERVRDICTRWMRGFNRRYAERQKNKALLKALPTVEFGRAFIEIEQQVKGFVQPLVQFGKISNQTALEQVGLDYETELSRKQEEEPYADLFTPQAAYAQFRPTKGDVVEYTPEGRPPEGTVPQKPIQVQAADVDAYERAILVAYDEMLAADDKLAAIDAFVDTVKGLNREHIKDSYIEGYNVAGGGSEITPERVEEAIRWNNDYLDNFAEDLRANADDDAKLKSWRSRAALYAPGGHKKGFMMGIFQASVEKGATGWRRVLHPELSLTGPCDVCIADSRLIHPITEEFWDHPFGVCSAQNVYFYRQYGVVEIPIGFPFTEFPVPYDRRVIRRVR